jgi:hypothetical protein
VPKIIDLAPAETEADGTCVYRPPLQALIVRTGGDVAGFLLEYPEVLRVMALASVTIFCVYLVREALN